MSKQYVDIPQHTTFNDISAGNFSLSATQYKSFCIKNKNVVSVRDFLSRDLERSDLGSEVGSEAYVEASNYSFIKTKALQAESYLLDIDKESVQNIIPKSFIDSNLKKGDLLISKDSNVGEIVILDKDYPNTMLCGGIYKLPVVDKKFYLLAFIKNDIFRQQIDFLVPRGSTIRHGKTKFLECKIPIPNKNGSSTIKYVELLMQAVVNKEIEIREKHNKILSNIQAELESNQAEEEFRYCLPTIEELEKLDRMDSSLYSKSFKEKEFLITNYKHGYATVDELGFAPPSRGQNLQISNIGKSIQCPEYQEGYYRLILPKFISKYGTVTTKEYLGNPNQLKTLNKGEIIFGAEGNEKGRSFVVIDEQENTITNIHGITLTQEQHNIEKSVFVKLFLDYYRDKGMIDQYAVGGNGGSLAIKYWDYLKFPKFPESAEKNIVLLYHNPQATYDASNCTLENFLEYDRGFNESAGIYELDRTMKYLQKKIDRAIDAIADDIPVEIAF